MKNIILQKGLLCAILLIILFNNRINGQALLIENFEYVQGTNLTSNGWNAHSGAGTNPVKVHSSGLSFSGYPYSDIGLSAILNNNGEDVNRSFSPATSGVVYFSFVVKISAVTNDYFSHFGKSTHTGKIYSNGTGTNFNFGLSLRSNPPVYSSGDQYTTGTVYLLVLKYSFVSGVQNDQVSLFVFSGSIPGDEPTVPTIGPLAEAGVDDVTSLANIALRQYSTSQSIIVDGICVATNWTDLIQVITSSSAQKETEIMVYPVPVASELHVKNIQNYNNIEIMDFNGSILLKKATYNKSEVWIIVENLESGIYFLRLKGDSEIITVPFIKD